MAKFGSPNGCETAGFSTSIVVTIIPPCSTLQVDKRAWLGFSESRMIVWNVPPSLIFPPSVPPGAPSLQTWGMFSDLT